MDVSTSARSLTDSTAELRSAGIDVRKLRVDSEHVFHERGPLPERSLLVVTAAAVIKNPFAGRYEPDLLPFMQSLRALGRVLSQSILDLVGSADAIEAYGKGAIVGEDGELEHGALWHEAGGWAMRESLGNPKAIVPAAKTIGGVGTRLIIPLGNVSAAYVRSHFGVADLSVWDAPRRDEIVFALAMASGGRIHARAGGLHAKDIHGGDGLR